MTFQGKIQRAKISLLRAKGLNDTEIARKLDLEPSTIGYHKRKIKENAQDDDGFLEDLLNNLENDLGI